MTTRDASTLLALSSRRQMMLTALGGFGAGAMFAGCAAMQDSDDDDNAVPPRSTGRPQQQGGANLDAKIFTFALNLEYLEAEYYSRGASGRGLEEQGVDVGRNPGRVQGGGQVSFSKPAFQDYANELAFNETAHVKFYREALGADAVDRPAIDFATGFTMAAHAAGLIEEGETFDPFENEVNFFLGGMLFEDTGVTAYRGATKLITDKKNLSAAAGILAVEAYHMGMVRSLLYEAGGEARRMANAVSDARDSLDGNDDLDQGIEVNGKANIVPCDANGICFERTPRQVLNIVYLERNALKGGFYPNGFNGDFTGLL